MATVSDKSTTSANQSDEDLKAALAEFETSILSPTISGELTRWLEHVQECWEEASAQIHFHVKHLHPRQYEEISKQDAELLPRIEQLEAEDDAIEQTRDQLNQS